MGKNSGKIKCLVVVLIVFSILLTGCKEGQSKTNGKLDKSTLDKVVDNEVLKVAILPDNPPWSVVDKNNEFKGYDVDIAKRLAESLGVELEIVTAEGANRLPLVESGKVDVVISSFTITDDRAKSIHFTEPYASAGSLPLFKVNNPIESLDDLAGKKVAVARGSTNDAILSEYFPAAEAVRFDSIADAFQALKTDKVDVLLEESPLVYEFSKNNNDMKALDIEPFKPGLIGMAVKKGDFDWLNYLNSFIRNLHSSGDNAEMYYEWFGTNPPQLYSY